MTKPINTDGIAKKLKTAALVPAAIIFVCVVIAVIVLVPPMLYSYAVKDEPISVDDYQIVLQHLNGQASLEFKTLFKERFADEVITNDELKELLGVKRQDNKAQAKLKHEETIASLKKIKDSSLGVELKKDE